MSQLGNPDTIDAIAVEYTRQAGALVRVGRSVRHDVGVSTWECARAVRFRVEVYHRDAAAARLAEEFHVLAAELRAAAARIRAELAELDAIERSVREAPWRRAR